MMKNEMFFMMSQYHQQNHPHYLKRISNFFSTKLRIIWGNRLDLSQQKKTFF
jgi:hypothetical protein